MKNKHKQIETGDVFPTNEGGSVTVIEYRGCLDVLIEHNDSFKHRATVVAGHLRNGHVKNPFNPSVFGVGYIAVGEYSAWGGGKYSPAYVAWRDMLGRCCYAGYQVKYPTYIGCSVSNAWHNFQVFAEWFYSQDNSQKAGFALDKDLRITSNKEYGPDTCSFVPEQINSLLNDSGASRGKYEQGVSAHGKGYLARLSVKGKAIYLGKYSTPEQAHAVYKAAKQANVRSMAVEYKEFLHPTVYTNLIGWSL